MRKYESAAIAIMEKCKEKDVCPTRRCKGFTPSAESRCKPFHLRVRLFSCFLFFRDDEMKDSRENET